MIAEMSKSAKKCLDCAAACPRHDTRERRWLHRVTCQYQAILITSNPRVKYAEHGVHQVQAAGGEPEPQFAALLEALVVDWLKEASTGAVARKLRLSGDEVDVSSGEQLLVDCSNAPH